MLQSDMEKIQKLLKQHRRSRKFESEFAAQMYNESHKSNRRHLNIAKDFSLAFPRLTAEKEYVHFEHAEAATMESVSVSADNQINEGPSEEDEQICRKNLRELRKLPTLDSDEQVRRIIAAFDSLSLGCKEEDIFIHLLQKYQALGGERTEDELRDKIQSDVLYLVKKER